MGKRLYQWLFRLTGVRQLYRDLVVEDRLTGVRGGIRRDLERLLRKVDRDNPFFAGRFTQFLLENEGANVSEAAYQTGFKDPSYFSKLYQEEFGVAPSTSRK